MSKTVCAFIFSYSLIIHGQIVQSEFLKLFVFLYTFVNSLNIVSLFLESSRKTVKKQKKADKKPEGKQAFEKELTDTSHKALKEFRSL